MLSIETIIKKPVSQNPYFELVLVGDINDADYVTKIETYTAEEFQKVLPVLAALQNPEYIYFEDEDDRIVDLRKKFYSFEGVCWDGMEYYRDELPYVSLGDYRAHTIERFEIYYYDENGVRYDVDLKVSKEDNSIPTSSSSNSVFMSTNLPLELF